MGTTKTKMKMDGSEVIGCPFCGKEDHSWNEVYYRENAKLIRVEGARITWCSSARQHVLHSIAKGILTKV